MKNKELLIIIIVAVILIALVTIGFLYFMTDLFKTEQQLFYKYLGQTEIINPDFIEQYNQVNEKLANNSSSSVANIDISMSAQNQDATQKILSISSNGLENKSLKQSYRDFIFSSNAKDFLTLRYIKDDNTYGLMVDSIVTKYLTVENSNLKDLFTKLGAQDTTDIPDSVSINSEEILKIDEPTWTILKDTYGKLLYNNISEEIYYKVKNEDKSTTIGLSLTEQETSEILRLVLETAQNDNVLLEVIVNKINSLDNKNITIDNIKEGIQELIDAIPDVSNSGVENFVNISFDLKNKKVIRLNLENNFQIQYKDYSGQIVSTTYKNVMKIDFSEQNKVIISAIQNDVGLGNITFEYSYNNEELGCKIGMTSADTSVCDIQYRVSGYKTENIVKDLKLSIPGESIITVEFTDTIQFKQDVQISKLTSENSVKLNDLTQEQLMVLFTAIGEQIEKVYGQSLSLFFGGEHILDYAEQVLKEQEKNNEKDEEETIKDLNSKIDDYFKEHSEKQGE